jgi:hypothetical protein
VGIELPRDDRLREIPDVGALLSRESGASQVRLGHGRDPFGRHGTRESLEPFVGGATSRQRYLLLEDDLDERLKAGSAVPQRRRAVTRHHRGEVRIPTDELGNAFGKGVGGQLRRHDNQTMHPTVL